jgi:hypothetical protein
MSPRLVRHPGKYTKCRPPGRRFALRFPLVCVPRWGLPVSRAMWCPQRPIASQRRGEVAHAVRILASTSTPSERQLLLEQAIAGATAR